MEKNKGNLMSERVKLCPVSQCSWTVSLKLTHVSTVSPSHARTASPHVGRLGEGRLISGALDNNGAL